MTVLLIGAAALVVAVDVRPIDDRVVDAWVHVQDVGAATITGIIRDGGTGVPVAGAVVSLPELGRTTVADSLGRYSLPNVPTGPQHLDVRSIGYLARTLHALVPAAGALDINVSLRPAPIQLDRLDVRSAGDASASYRAGYDTDPRATGAALRRDPREPDVFSALASGHVTADPETPSGLHAFGGASDQTAYLLNGIPILSPYHAAGSFSGWNPDVVDAIRLSSSISSSATLSTALSSVVSAATLSPGPRLETRGSVSTTQARVTAAGPLGVRGVGYIVSLRSGLPGALSPDEPSYVRGEAGDVLGLLEGPALGGLLRVQGYDNENELDADAAAFTTPDDGNVVRNRFGWRSQSVGATWTREFEQTSADVRAWFTSAGADASWNPAEQEVATSVDAVRRDLAVEVSVRRDHGTGISSVGARLEQVSTDYRVVRGSTPTDPNQNNVGAAGTANWSLSGRIPLVTAFGEYQRPFGPFELALGAASTASRDDWRIGPRASLAATPASGFTVVATAGRTHQFSQALRNRESVVGSIFPAELFAVAGERGVPDAGGRGVPVARNDQASVALQYSRPAGLRVTATGYAREIAGLLLTAPVTGAPFPDSGFATGSGRARGLAIDVAADGARHAVVARWLWQRVRLADRAGHRYVPGHATAHVVDFAASLFRTATSSIRVSLNAEMGRRATPIRGRFEWEACNLLDQGCEFAGSPQTDVDAVGNLHLPPYLRFDLGLRQHWHLRLGGRDANVGLFATVTNLLGRRNVLTYALDPTTGARSAIEMRPRAPLVLGMDWRF